MRLWKEHDGALIKRDGGGALRRRRGEGLRLINQRERPFVALALKVAARFAVASVIRRQFNLEHSFGECGMTRRFCIETLQFGERRRSIRHESDGCILYRRSSEHRGEGSNPDEQHRGRGGGPNAIISPRPM